MLKKFKSLTFEKQVYVLGLLLIPFLIIGIIIFPYIFNFMKDIHFKCAIYEITGWYCPGCGGTRAINYLLHGNIIKSFIYHPIVVSSIIMYLIYMISHTIAIFKKDYKGIEIQIWHSLLLLGIVILNFIIKNILLLKFGIQLL